MGASLSVNGDILSQSLLQNRELDISTRLSEADIAKHSVGEPVIDCLTGFPSYLLTDVSLYERVNAAFNAITAVPHDFPLRLPHLRYLNLNSNYLSELPESIALLFHLSELHVAHNRLSSLPRNIVHMRSLQVLDLSHNRFTQLPDSVGRISSLQRLNVSDNRLQSLPTSLAQCRSLTVLLADNNRFTDSSVSAAGSDQLLVWLRAMAEPERGDGSAGRGGVQFARVTASHSTQRLERLQKQSVKTSEVARVPLLPPNGASRLSADALRDALAGLVVGAALGDALGLATDGMSGDQARFCYRSDYDLTDMACDRHRWLHYRPGDCTLNTHVMMVVMDSMLHWSGVLDELDLAGRLCDWWSHLLPDPDTRSTLFARVITAEGFLERPHSTARREMALALRDCSVSDHVLYYDSCLPSALICGIPRFHNIREVTDNAVRVCLTTHSASLCEAGCVFIALLVAKILQGALSSPDDVTTVIKELCELTCRKLVSSAEQYALRWCLTHYQTESLPESLSPGCVNSSARLTGSVVLSALSVCCRALYRAVVDEQRSDDTARDDLWRHTVTAVTLRGGRASVAGTLCGAVLGARLGHSRLPTQLLDQLNATTLQRLQLKINQLMDLMAL